MSRAPSIKLRARRRALTGRTVAFMWDAFVLHIGDGADAERLQHSAVQLAIGVGGRVAGRASRASWVTGDAIVVRPNVAHAFRSGRFALFWIEPTSDPGRRLIQAYCRHRAITPLRAVDLAAIARRAESILDQRTSCDEAWQFAMDALGSIVGDLPFGRVVHPAIRRALRAIDAAPQRKISAVQLAAEVGLSPSRLTHLFRDTMGVPLRRYLMWDRLRRAVALLLRGRTATEVAHEVGFTDTAHLNRVMRMMIGARPSDLSSASHITLHVCSRPGSTSSRSPR